MDSSQLIKNLTLHQRYWTIKVLLTEKDSVRKFKAGEGKIQKLTLMDREGSKIHGIMFNETIDKFETLLKIGNTYIISNGQIKQTNKNFYNVNDNIEIILNNLTEIRMTIDDNISSSITNLSTFEEIKGSPNLPADIILLVTNVYELRTVYRQRDKKSIVKRDLQVIGLRSDIFIFTLWESLASIEGKQLEDLKNDKPIILAKSVVGKHFNGFTLSTTSSTIIEINPDMPTSKEILDWYNEYTFSTPSIVEGYLFTELLQINSCEHSSGEIKYYDTNVTIKGIKQEGNLWYNACDICKSKVIIDEDKVECMKCSKNNVGYSLRYLIKLDVEDGSSSANFTVFDDEAETLIGMPVADLHKLQKYNMFVAQIGCAAIGVLALSIFGPGWLARATALAASIAFMTVTGSIHPPGGLDFDAEIAVQEALYRLMLGRSTIIIAKLLCLIRNAEYIAVMEEAQLI